MGEIINRFFQRSQFVMPYCTVILYLPIVKFNQLMNNTLTAVGLTTLPEDVTANRHSVHGRTVGFCRSFRQIQRTTDRLRFLDP